MTRSSIVTLTSGRPVKERGPELMVGLAALSAEQRLVVDVVLGEESVLQVRVVGVDHLDVEVGELVFACGHAGLPIVVGIATASTAGWIQAAVRRGERASPGWCDRGRLRGRAAKRGGRCGGPAGTGARARPARARLPAPGVAAQSRPVTGTTVRSDHQEPGCPERSMA